MTKPQRLQEEELLKKTSRNKLPAILKMSIGTFLFIFFKLGQSETFSFCFLALALTPIIIQLYHYAGRLHSIRL